MSKKVIHLVCNQHFDLVWRRPVKWYVERRTKIYFLVLRLLERHPEMTYNFNQTLPFRLFLEEHPEVSGRVGALLQAGRLEIAGGPESIPDLNMSSAAAWLCNIESGMNFWRREFGYRVRGGAMEDAFGIPDMLPAVIAHYYEYFKASRMPRPNRADINGDFRLTGADGTTVRAISPEADFSLWGWGCSQNPDVPDYTVRKRCDVIRQALRQAGAKSAKPDSLFVFCGEEQLVLPQLPTLVREIAAEFSDLEFRFSSYNDYYDALPAGYWEKTPEYRMPEEDFSRLFTGCYVSRSRSKRQPKVIESRLFGSRCAGANGRIPARAWEALFYLQFHDALCGCHIDSNADWLAERAAEADAALAGLPLAVPWRRLLPPLGGVPTAVLAKCGVVQCGDWQIAWPEESNLPQLSYQGRPVAIPQVVLREEHGTLWTEEYSGRRFVVPQSEAVVTAFTGDGNSCRVELHWSSRQRFLDKWPGFSALEYYLELSFQSDWPGMRVCFRPNLLGNSTEIALRYDLGAPVGEVKAGQPLGWRWRGSYEATLLQGNSFPAFEWVGGPAFAVFHLATPGWALRDGGLENIVLRSPVKRWAPWFPVTPTVKMHENGFQEFQQLFWPSLPSEGECFRLAREYQLAQSSGEYRGIETALFDDLPDNLVILDWDGGRRLVLSEVAGSPVQWRNQTFKAHQLAVLDSSMISGQKG